MPDLITTKFQPTNQIYPKNTYIGNTLTSVKTLRNKAYEKDVTTAREINLKKKNAPYTTCVSRHSTGAGNIL